MNKQLRADAEEIIRASIQAVLPDEAVERALKIFVEKNSREGRIYLVAAGKAAWQMAHAAVEFLSADLESESSDEGSAPDMTNIAPDMTNITDGIVITKYEHVKGELPGIRCYEAGHPVPDENSFRATAEALKMIRDAELTKEDTVLFLLSGGGSALFEKPLISGEELQDITRQLLACGADITEINTIRKRLSAVKGGRFAKACEPASVFSVVLSDIVGDPLDMIASGPAYPDSTTCADARAISEKYGLKLSADATNCLEQETPKALTNVTTMITGSVRELVKAAAEKAREFGYEPVILTNELGGEARDAGVMLAEKIRETHDHEGSASGQTTADGSIANIDAEVASDEHPRTRHAFLASDEHHRRRLAFLAGGETIVHLTGKGLGGRNQELALAAAPGIAGIRNAAVFSFGSDGTDGPTDAAGGYVDGETFGELQDKGIDVQAILRDNDAYHALQAVDGLIITGPTGTNVNDVAIALIG